jgi:hypothetical protein
VQRLRRTILTVGVVLATAVTALAALPAQAASAGCSVNYAVTSSWQGGFGATVTVTNLGDPLTNWILTWSFGAGQQVTQAWNTTLTQSGSQVTAKNVGYNGSIATGGAASFGFNGSWTGSNPAPAAFALNGLACTGSTTPTTTPTTTPATAPATRLPCDIYAAGGTPCVAAHSTTRALFAAYGGSLYQVRRSSDNTTRDIGPLTRGGTANAAGQDSFCAGTTCVITVVYDQSGHGNNLAYQGPGGAGGQDTPATATSEALTVNGSKAYSLYINPRNSYWHNGSASGVPTGSAPEGEYLVTSGTHVNGGCCFDYGNSETDRQADGAGAMDAIYFGTSCWFGGCSGSGPWVQADLEYGLHPGGSQSWNPNQRAFTSRFVTAMLKNNGTSRFAIKGANAQSGAPATLWDGALPNGYSPMRKQGAIVLGSGGDCCATNTNQSLGAFYEGAMVAGYPSDATESGVQAAVVAAGYR